MLAEVYDRQHSLELNIPDAITIVGVGGIGTWVAIYAAMTGVKNIFIFDPDNLEVTNLNRLPFCEYSVGQPKVNLVVDYVRSIRPDCNIIGVASKLEGILKNLQIVMGYPVIECTDSPKSQIELYKECVARGIPFIRAGYDGTHITVTSNVSGWVQADDEERATYTFNPSWVVPASIVAALAVAKLCKFTNQEVCTDLSEIGIPQLKKSQPRVSNRCRQ
jgi:molybdopterin/thiamine biosynthesis adenylyltransferase